MPMDLDRVELRANGTQYQLTHFVDLCGRRRGLRMKQDGTGLTLSIGARHTESVGPFVEASSVRSQVELWLEDLDAIVESSGLETRPSRIWAAIGNAADERAVARDRGTEPSIGLLHYLRVEEIDGRRIALDDRRPLTTPTGSMPTDFGSTKFDDASWHAEAAEGQPEGNAWTHIALFVTWLIRHDLIAPESFKPEHVAGVKAGAIVDRHVFDWSDYKLVSDLMNDRGEAFTAATYEAYMAGYADVFAAEPDYSIPADVSTYERVEPMIDRLWSQWITERASNA